MEPRVVAQEHFSHAARPELLENLVGSHAGPQHADRLLFVVRDPTVASFRTPFPLGFRGSGLSSNYRRFASRADGCPLRYQRPCGPIRTDATPFSVYSPEMTMAQAAGPTP